MSQKRFLPLTGILLIVGAVLVNVPYTLLAMTFDYPDILRAPTGDILTKFANGGPELIWTWLAFAWVGLPILLGVLLLPRVLLDDTNSDLDRQALNLATFFGATGLIAQMIGLLRWPLVVPTLARLYTEPGATETTHQAVAAVFQAVHQYGGVVMGEHIGQTFTIFWMGLLSVTLLRLRNVPRLLPWTGLAAAGVYALGQGELLATVMPDFPYWGEAGMVGSLMWLGWLIYLGIVLLRKARGEAYEYTRPNSQRSVEAI